jgi:putative endonuclease
VKLVGNRAEQLAAIFLEQRGLELRETNYRCRFGEIDLILHDGRTLVFAEVRMRRGSAFGGPAASITAAKRTRLIRTAQHYLMENRCSAPCRFDVVLLQELDLGSIEWIPDAFGA